MIWVERQIEQFKTTDEQSGIRNDGAILSWHRGKPAFRPESI